MCYAIPVLGDHDADVFSESFKYYRHADEKVYRKETAEENYKNLIRMHTLRGIGIRD